MLILAALLPLRAVAGVVIGFCANGHQELPVASQAVQGGHALHDTHAGDVHPALGAHHVDDREPAKPVNPTCSICAEHCSSAAFAPPSALQVVAVPVPAACSPRESARAVPPFFPDQLDRPPLA